MKRWCGVEWRHEQKWCHKLQASNFVGNPLQSPSSWRPFLATPFSPSLVYCSSNNFPRWDSNAENFRRRNFTSNNGARTQQQQQQQQWYQKKRRWWSDEDGELEEEQDLEDAFQSVWFLQIFKSYGWTLPVILTSWLLYSGPKAFLMALILPLGQSALALAFEKLWGRPESKPKRKYKYRMRRKARDRNSATVEEEPQENQKTRKGYQSWVAEDNGSVDKGNREEAPSFGGWDDLERSRPATKSSRAMDGSPRMPMEGGRLSRRERKSDTPLLLRLLIAIFPFLGSWTKML